MFFNVEYMEYWQEQEEIKKQKKLLKEKFPLIGQIVYYKGEYGVVLYDEDDNDYMVRWDTNRESDYEGFGLPYKYIDKYEFKYINMDGTLKIK